ncbi:DUF3703 domain-containing protein [Nonomuraea sp. NPDC000554]|uniref:DUF3703 domain-containing protein n=1 Tax=Nonomuraea sp. NPDC000554 TaxID=3154259 RepID=UPI003319909E
MEGAHILSQPWPWPHTRDHIAMFALAIAQRDRREASGQVVRIIGDGADRRLQACTADVLDADVRAVGHRLGEQAGDRPLEVVEGDQRGRARLAVADRPGRGAPAPPVCGHGKRRCPEGFLEPRGRWASPRRIRRMVRRADLIDAVH